MTAVTFHGYREPTAIRAGRVLVLTEREQETLREALAALNPQGLSDKRYWLAFNRITYGDEYINATDERVRLHFEKQHLEAAVKKLNTRIAELDEAIVEEMAERGDRSGNHAATGANYRVDSRIDPKLIVPTTEDMGKDEIAYQRTLVAQQVAEALLETEHAEIVVHKGLSFNQQTLGARLRAPVLEHRAEQLEKPEHERRPMALEEFVPAPLRGLVELSEKPKILVTAGKS